MQNTSTLSWFNSPSLPSSSTIPNPFHLDLIQYSTLPTPQRRAPPPPVSHPRRRRRPRHIRMQEPASKGLFTLQEVDEVEDEPSDYGYASTSAGRSIRMLSARASSEALSPSPVRPRLDLPQDVGVFDGDEEELVIVANRLSWVTASSTTGVSPSATPSPTTPSTDIDDPFFVDVPLDIDASDLDTSYSTFIASYPSIASRPRRPPPLDLSRTHPYAYSAEINRWYTDVESATPKSTPTSTLSPSTTSLLPSLPILTSSEYQGIRSAKTPTAPRFSQRKSHSDPPPTSHLPSNRKDPFDLVSALEDLLASCGVQEEEINSPTYSHWSDDSSDSESDTPPRRAYKAFPMPPHRSPVLSPASASSTSSFGAGLPITPRTPRLHSSLPPIPSTKDQKKRSPMRPVIMGDHSYLFHLSSEASPIVQVARSASSPLSGVASNDRPDSRGSSGSGSSRSGKLPSRSKLPMEWTRI